VELGRHRSIHGWEASWNATGLDGYAEIRATGTGPETVTAMVAVEVHTSSPALELSLSRAAFSPNRDRSAEWTVVTVSVDEDAARALEILDAEGKVRRRLADEPIGAGRTSVRWNGTGASGRTLADGRYEVRAAVADEVGNVAGTIVPVIVDTKVPRSTGTGPGRSLRGGCGSRRASTGARSPSCGRRPGRCRPGGEAVRRPRTRTARRVRVERAR
jgi:hypothetical protein